MAVHLPKFGAEQQLSCVDYGRTNVLAFLFSTIGLTEWDSHL